MSPPRRVILLGSTGSIGENTLEVIRHMRDLPGSGFELVGLAAGSRHQQLLEQAAEFGVREVALADTSRADGLDFSGTLHAGPGSARALVESVAREGDLVVAAIVGSAGIDAVLAAIKAGCDVALANKETLVAAGALVMPQARERGIHLIPVDSEHSAVFQCLNGVSCEREIRRLVITASGGPFRGMDRDAIRKATPEQALAHPTWTMGTKITIDSASMMNKALEVIEAHWLFDLPPEKIDVIVHPQSIIHSFVEYVDGSVLAQLGPPDMKTPIQYAMTWPHRLEGCSARMDWAELRSLVFEQLDHEAFPPVRQAHEVIRRGGTAGAVFNAANEVAVEAFLGHDIPFGGIHDLVTEAIEAIPVKPVESLADIATADEEARSFVRESNPRNETVEDVCTSGIRRERLMEFFWATLNILLFIVGFGLLIFVHELGHFLAAKWAGIRTEAFAIGFGPPIFSWRRGVGFTAGSTNRPILARTGRNPRELTDEDMAREGLGETEYSIRWLPLGGFVRMLGQDDLAPASGPVAAVVSTTPRSGSG